MITCKRRLPSFILKRVFSSKSAVNTMTKCVAVSSMEWPSLVQTACDILGRGGVIAVPTDTIYGISTLAQSSPAVQKLYQIKGRNSAKPIAISVADVSDVYRWANVTVSETLLHELLPGPVTVVFDRKLNLNPELNPGTSLVGVRVPNCQFMREICRCMQQPLALTSANISNQPSSLSVDEFKDLWPMLDCVFDGGLLSETPEAKQGSTVVDLSKRGLFTVIRNGSALEATTEILTRHGLKEDFKR